MPRYERILITGAAGRLGSELSKGLAPLARTLRLAGRAPFGELAPHEEEAVFDLADMEATIAATKDCDAIVHFGGAALESPWQAILDSNIRGSYHIYEGAPETRRPSGSSTPLPCTPSAITRWRLISRSTRRCVPTASMACRRTSSRA